MKTSGERFLFLIMTEKTTLSREFSFLLKMSSLVKFCCDSHCVRLYPFLYDFDFTFLVFSVYIFENSCSVRS